jgi:hypothetical protein
MMNTSRSIGMSTSADSASVSSGKANNRRMKKRSSNAMLLDDGLIDTSATSKHENRQGKHRERKNEDEADEAFGFGCVGCGRWRHDPQDPFGVKSVLRTMIQDKFSSRVDFSEDVEPRRRYPVAVNFVEHRL